MLIVRLAHCRLRYTSEDGNRVLISCLLQKLFKVRNPNLYFVHFFINDFLLISPWHFLIVWFMQVAQVLLLPICSMGLFGQRWLGSWLSRNQALALLQDKCRL